jgi:hypothetical protein
MISILIGVSTAVWGTTKSVAGASPVVQMRSMLMAVLVTIILSSIYSLQLSFSMAISLVFAIAICYYTLTVVTHYEEMDWFKTGIYYGLLVSFIGYNIIMHYIDGQNITIVKSAQSYLT